MELDVSFGKCRSDRVWKPQYLSWDEFTDRLKKVRRTSETMAQYDEMTIKSQHDIKDGAAFVGGLVRGGRRIKVNIDTRSLITLDADYPGKDFLDTVDLMLGGNAYAIYSTHSHRPAKNKYRFVAPCDRHMSPDEYAAVSRKIAETLGMDYFDATTFDVNRLMYFPSCSQDATPELTLGQGQPIGVDAVLAEYADWRDPLKWPRHPREKVKRTSRAKMEDPETKKGVVGAFCRCYSISEAIGAFLPDAYESIDVTCTRYTYAGASSYGGLVVYDEDTFAYSHHESDPISGREVNAFDLVRIHKFGDLDERASEKTNMSKLPSYTAMQVFASQDPTVKKDRLADLAEDFEDEDFEEVTAALEVHPKTGKPVPTAGNIEIMLTHGQWRGVLAYDAFGNSEVIKSDLPWRCRERPHEEYESWLGADDKRMYHWFAKTHDFRTTGLIQNAFTEVVHMHKFHPIIDYIESQEWDGTPRVEKLFVEYLGAEDSRYVRTVTRKTLLAAVKRLYDPGCKFDYMLVLVGPQGAYKSTIIQMLARQWFSDSLKKFETKEAGEHLQSAWIFEFGELAGMSKAEVDEIKQFITKRSDKYRVAYDRVVSDFPRKCIFFGTTNNWDFLKDPTGNRRFWPVAIDPGKRTKNVFAELTDYEVVQIWAEALQAYRKGEVLTLPPDVDQEAAKTQGAHMEDDPRFGYIQDWLDRPIDDDLGSTTEEFRNRVCAMQLWAECLHVKSSMRPWEAREICGIMRRMPGWQELKTRTILPGYGKQTIFERDRCADG